MTGAAYWPWWLAAASLAVITVGCCIVARRPLGVSGIVGRFVNLRGELDAERQRRAMAAADEAALEAALLAATAEAFGALAPEGVESAGARPGAAACAGTACPPAADPTPLAAPALPASGLVAAAGDAPAAGCGRSCSSPASRPSLGAHAVFLLAIVLGGAAAQIARGGWSPRLDMGPTFHALFGGGPLAWLVLGAGGVLVGIGTTLSGGCSTGHGLSGCSRLQPGSVAATAAFVGAGVLVSLLLQRSLS